MNKVYYKFLLISSMFFSIKGQVFQNFFPASLWSFENYTSSYDNETTRTDKASFFMKDTQKWENENLKIPAHSFDCFEKDIRLISYNIRHWTNALGQPSKDKILRVIKELNADILVLQEFDFDSNFYPDCTVEDWTNIFRELGYNYGGIETLAIIWAPHSRRYGTVIFSKLPIISNESKKFITDFPDTDKQSYTHCIIEAQGTQISVYGTHFAAETITIPPASYAETIRKAQIEHLTTIIKQDIYDNACIAADCNAVRKSDFNYTINGVSAWELIDKNYLWYAGVHRSSEALDYMEAAGFKDIFDYCHCPAPKVTTLAGLPVDHIFLSPQWKLPTTDAYLFFSDASDHYPVILDIRLY